MKNIILLNNNKKNKCEFLLLNLNAIKDNIEVYRSMFRPLSKSIHKKGSKCILKLIVDKNNNNILGCHMIGESAAEIIQMASISLLLGAKKSDFDMTMALHPTIAEEFVTML